MSGREALVDATKHLLSTQGFEATSPADIQRAAGVGQGSFYHHFASKADLAHAALDELADAMIAEFGQLDTGDAVLVDEYLGLPRSALAGCRIGRLCMESSLADERIREPVGRYFAHLRTRLSEAFTALGTGVDPAALADLAIASVQGAYVVSRATADPSVMSNATGALRELLAATTTRTDCQ